MESHRLRPRFHPGEWLWVILLILTVGFLWCATYHRWSAAAWAVPITYDGDAWWGMAASKAVAEGEMLPFLSKTIPSLNAPYQANWNDYPSVEEGSLGWTGWLASVYGVFRGVNAAVFSAHLFAALAFYFVCRRFRYDPLFAFAGAIVFGFSRYIFSRGFHHFGLSFYWHIPLGLLAVWWCASKAPVLEDRRKLAACVAIAAVHGIHNPYYTGMFGQLLVLASLCQLVRGGGWKRVVMPLVLIGAAALSFVVANLDTFIRES